MYTVEFIIRNNTEWQEKWISTKHRRDTFSWDLKNGRASENCLALLGQWSMKRLTMAWHFSNGLPEDPWKRRASFRLEYRHPRNLSPISQTLTSKDTFYVFQVIENIISFHGEYPAFFHEQKDLNRSVQNWF